MPSLLPPPSQKILNLGRVEGWAGPESKPLANGRKGRTCIDQCLGWGLLNILSTEITPLDVNPCEWDGSLLV